MLNKIIKSIKKNLNFQHVSTSPYPKSVDVLVYPIGLKKDFGETETCKIYKNSITVFMFLFNNF